MRMGFDVKTPGKRRPPQEKKRIFTVYVCIGLGAVLIFIAFIASWALRCAKPVIISMAQNRAGDVMVYVINEAVAEQIEISGLSYSDFVSIEKTDDGKISSISTNTAKMNAVKAQILKRIQEKLEDYETIEVKVPLGAMLDLELLTGLGPRIKFEMLSTGCVNADFSSSLESAGINQSKHQIDISVTAELGVISMLGDITTEVKTSVPIAQSVIVGEVPKGYVPSGTY